LLLLVVGILIPDFSQGRKLYLQYGGGTFFSERREETSSLRNDPEDLNHQHERCGSHVART